MTLPRHFDRVSICCTACSALMLNKSTINQSKWRQGLRQFSRGSARPILRSRMRGESIDPRGTLTMDGCLDVWLTDMRSEHVAAAVLLWSVRRRGDRTGRATLAYRRDDRQPVPVTGAHVHVPAGQIASTSSHLNGEFAASPAAGCPARWRGPGRVRLFTVRARSRRLLQDDLVDEVNVRLDVARGAHDLRVLADLIEPLGGYCFHCATHHRVVFEHGSKVVDGQREQTAVGLRPHAGDALGRVRQQTDLCTHRENTLSHTEMAKLPDSMLNHTQLTLVQFLHFSAVHPCVRK